MTKKYDVAIIGGGMGGLITGLYLQQMGKRSIILEHGQQVGGNMSGIWRKGFYFDCGDQSMEDFGVLFPVLKELDLYDPAEWEQIRWRFVTPDSDVTLRSYDQMRDDYKKFFPDAADALDEWFNYFVPMCRMFEKFIPHMGTWITYGGPKRTWSYLRMLQIMLPEMKRIKTFMNQSATEVCARIFSQEPRLKYLFGEYGYPNTAMMVSATLWYIFINDYHYPKSGIQGLMDKLSVAYQERGGEIRLNSTVDRVMNIGKTVKGLETSRDEYVEADYYVNTGNPKRLVTKMLDDPSVWDYSDRQKILNEKVTMGNVSAYLGVDFSADELLPILKEHHTTYWRTYESPADIYDKDLHRKGWSLINAPSLFLPHLAPEGKTALVLQIYAPYQWMNDWETHAHDPFKRTAAYRKLKEKVLDDMITDTEYIIPDLSKKIIYKELATPRTLARWTLNPDGSSMGWGLDVYTSHMAKELSRMRTPINNLYNAGQYSMWLGGVISAMFTGRIVAKGIYTGFVKQFLY